MKLSNCFVILGLLSILSCQTAKDNWEPRIYQGSHEKLAVHRQGGKEVIKCESPDFSEMFCMDKAELEKMYGRCLEKDLDYK